MASKLWRRRGEQRAAVWYDYADNPLGVRVTEDYAPRLAPVFAAHRHIVDYVSTLPVDAYRKDGDQSVDIALPQLFVTPDAIGGPGLVAWLGQAAYGLATGNAVGWIADTDGFGFPTNVQWLHWSQWSFDEMRKQWAVGGVDVPSSRIVHIPWMVPPGRTLGLSPIEHYAALVRSGIAAQDYGDISTNFPSAVFRNTAKTVSPEESQAIRTRLKASMRRKEPLVTGNDWDFTPVTIPPNQAMFIEQQKLTANQIASIYGIDPTEVGGTAPNSLTYSTEELRELRKAAEMRPYLVRLERGLSRLLPAKQFACFNVDATLRMDAKTKFEVFLMEREIGSISVNEIRALLDRPPIGPAGDSYMPTPRQQPPTQTRTAEFANGKASS